MTRFAFQCFWLLFSDWLSIFRIFLPIRSSFWFCNQSSQLIKNSTQCEHLNNSLGNVSILQLHCRMIISISVLILLDLQFQSLFTNRDLRGPLPLITKCGQSLFTARDLRGPLCMSCSVYLHTLRFWFCAENMCHRWKNAGVTSMPSLSTASRYIVPTLIPCTSQD